MLVQTIKADRIQAMKDKDLAKRSTLELVLALLEKEKVTLKLATVEDLSQAQAETIVSRYIKALDKEALAYAEAGKSTEKQDKERELLSQYLPKQMTEEEILQYIQGLTVDRTMPVGKFIGMLNANLKGQAPGALISKVAKEWWG